MGEPLVLTEVTNRVAVISFNRPERHNALSDALCDEWATAVHAAIDDDAVGCIVLRGEGRSFSSGRDTTELGRRRPGETDYAFIRRAQEIRLATIEAPKPVIAAVRGYCLGGAFEIALSADMRIAATDAVFAFPEIHFGLVPDTGGTQLLTVLAGPARAKYLVISGDRLSAADALDWGVVDRVVPPGELDGAAATLAHRLAAAPPTAAAAAKQLVDHVWAGAVRNGLRQELLAQAALFAGEEHHRARAAHAARMAAREDGRRG